LRGRLFFYGRKEATVEMTARQRAFVEAYTDNATEAAIKAGYSPKTAYSQGQRLLKNVEIAQAIRERENERNNPHIATREKRQQFWTRVMNDPNEDMKDRLTASKLLGQSEGDFLDRVEHSGEMELQVNTRAEIRTFLLDREREKRHAGGGGDR